MKATQKENIDFLSKFSMLNIRDQEEIIRIIEIKLEMDREKRKRDFRVIK